MYKETPIFILKEAEFNSEGPEDQGLRVRSFSRESHTTKVTLKLSILERKDPRRAFVLLAQAVCNPLPQGVVTSKL